MSYTLERVRAIIVAKDGIDAGAVNPEATLDALGIDSLERCELQMEFEDEFGVPIGDEEIDSIVTVGELVILIDSKRGRQ